MKPIVRWAGGKGAMADEVAAAAQRWLAAHQAGVYFEPFLGGGAVALALAPQVPQVPFFLSDACTPLIHAYRTLVKYPRQVVNEVAFLVEQGIDKEAYNNIRGLEPNGGPIREAARFFYLNSLAWNGLWRVNSRGEFNVPFGRRANPRFLSMIEAQTFSNLLGKRTSFTACDFVGPLQRARAGDFVFADPPYAGGFVDYTEEGFAEWDQEDLANMLKATAQRGAAIVMTNADRPEIRELYSWASLRETKERRAINSKPDGRAPVGCLIAYAPATLFT